MAVTMRVPQARLVVENLDAHKVVARVLQSGRFIGGPEVDQFAKRWAKYCHTKYCIPTASGSAALVAAIRAMSVPGDKIMVPAFSFAATTSVVLEAGCRPVYCDVTPYGLMDWEMAEDLAPDVDGIMPVHLFGQRSVIPDHILTQLVYIIEDACQAHGLFGCGPMLQGDVACYSFYPSKNLGAVGDAGALVTDRDDTADYVAAWVNYGDPPGQKYVHRMPSTNARMDAIQAAFLNMRLAQLGDNNANRAATAGTYKAEDVPSIATAEPSVWHLYPVLAHDPDELIRKLLQEYGVEVGRHYPYTLPHVSHDGYQREFPVAERLARHVVTLPIGPHVTGFDARYVANSLKDVAQLNDEGMWRLV